MNNRAFTLTEVLVALALGTLVLLGISGFYLSTVRFYGQSNSQAFLQRQASHIIEEMGRQIRPARQLALGICGEVEGGLQVTNKALDGTDQTYCFYSRDGQLFERLPNNSDFNLLSGSLAPLTVTSFTAELSNSTTAKVTFVLKDNASNSMKLETALSRRN